MCDPVTLGIAVAASGAGAYLTGKNQSDQAKAANDILAGKLGTISGYGDKNQKTLGTLLQDYTPTAQGAQLVDAQNTRTNNTVSNISTPEAAGMNDIPIGANSPGAVKSEIAKRMLSVHDGAVNRAKAMGKLGGYGDSWFTNMLNNEEAGRNIHFNDELANGQKALIGPEQQLAMAGKYSPLGSYLSGAGSILGSASGVPGGGMIGKGVGSIFGGGSSLPPIPQQVAGLGEYS